MFFDESSIISPGIAGNYNKKRRPPTMCFGGKPLAGKAVGRPDGNWSNTATNTLAVSFSEPLPRMLPFAPSMAKPSSEFLSVTGASLLFALFATTYRKCDWTRTVLRQMIFLIFSKKDASFSHIA